MGKPIIISKLQNRNTQEDKTMQTWGKHLLFGNYPAYLNIEGGSSNLQTSLDFPEDVEYSTAYTPNTPYSTYSQDRGGNSFTTNYGEVLEDENGPYRHIRETGQSAMDNENFQHFGIQRLKKNKKGYQVTSEQFAPKSQTDSLTTAFNRNFGQIPVNFNGGSIIKRK